MLTSVVAQTDKYAAVTAAEDRSNLSAALTESWKAASETGVSGLSTLLFHGKGGAGRQWHKIENEGIMCADRFDAARSIYLLRVHLAPSAAVFITRRL